MKLVVLLLLLAVSSAAWAQTAPVCAQFPNHVCTTRNIATTLPLQGGGALSADLTLTCRTATASVSGCLAVADWNTFNNKVPPTRALTTTAPLTIGGGASADLSVDRTLACNVASSAQPGCLAAADFKLQAFVAASFLRANGGL